MDSHEALSRVHFTSMKEKQLLEDSLQKLREEHTTLQASSNNDKEFLQGQLRKEITECKKTVQKLREAEEENHKMREELVKNRDKFNQIKDVGNKLVAKLEEKIALIEEQRGSEKKRYEIVLFLL